MPASQTHPYDDWAELYDQVYAYLTDDVPFYVQQAMASGGPVLELGCGTGRVSLAIVKAGVAVHGIDISPRMVARAAEKAKAAKLRKRAFETGDMRSFAIAGKQFPLAIMPFRSFQSLLTVDDQRSTLAAVKAHLKPGGRLVLDIFAPDIQMLAASESDLFHLRDVPQPDTGHKLVLWGKNDFDHVDQTNAARLVIEELDPNGVVMRRVYRDFTVRYTFRYEMQHLLESCGFTVEAVYGDFDGGPVTADSDDLVWVARAGA